MEEFTEFNTSRGVNRGVHVILILSSYRIKMYGSVWENQGFVKIDHGLLYTADLYSYVYSFQRESMKYMNSGRIS